MGVNISIGLVLSGHTKVIKVIEVQRKKYRFEGQIGTLAKNYPLEPKIPVLIQSDFDK